MAYGKIFINTYNWAVFQQDHKDGGGVSLVSMWHDISPGATKTLTTATRHQCMCEKAPVVSSLYCCIDKKVTETILFYFIM